MKKNKKTGRKPKYLYKIGDEYYTRSQLAELKKIAPRTLERRLRDSNNQIIETTFMRPWECAQKHFLRDLDGALISLSDCCRKYDIEYQLGLRRYQAGCRDINILKKPAYGTLKGEINGTRKGMAITERNL